MGMFNKKLIHLFSAALLSTICCTSVSANTIKPVADTAKVEELTQSIASGVLTKLGIVDQENSELQTMSLDKVVSTALHAGKPIEEIREAVSQVMEDLTGKPLGYSVKAEAAPAAAESVESVNTVETSVVTTEDAVVTERTIPLTTVLLPNESLSTVAKRIYGADQGRRYLDIYELNKDVITNINVVPEGTVLKLPE